MTDLNKNTTSGVNSKMVDAFNQTDRWNRGGDWMSDLLEHVDLDKIMSQVDHFNKMVEVEKMMGVGCGEGFGRGRKMMGLGCGEGFGMVGGGGLAVLPMIAGYFMMNGFMLLIVCCILAYVVYLKTNNTCCNEKCSFNLNKDMVYQMKLDALDFVKKLMRLALHKSVCVVKFISKIVGVCNHVYSKGVEELIRGLEVECDVGC